MNATAKDLADDVVVAKIVGWPTRFVVYDRKADAFYVTINPLSGNSYIWIFTDWYSSPNSDAYERILVEDRDFVTIMDREHFEILWERHLVAAAIWNEL